MTEGGAGNVCVRRDWLWLNERYLVAELLTHKQLEYRSQQPELYLEFRIWNPYYCQRVFKWRTYFNYIVCRVLNIPNVCCLLPALNVLAEEDGDGMFAPLVVEILLLCWGVAEVRLQAPPVASQH